MINAVRIFHTRSIGHLKPKWRNSAVISRENRPGIHDVFLPRPTDFVVKGAKNIRYKFSRFLFASLFTSICQQRDKGKCPKVLNSIVDMILCPSERLSSWRAGSELTGHGWADRTQSSAATNLEKPQESRPQFCYVSLGNNQEKCTNFLRRLTYFALNVNNKVNYRGGSLIRARDLSTTKGTRPEQHTHGVTRGRHRRRIQHTYQLSFRILYKCLVLFFLAEHTVLFDWALWGRIFLERSPADF